ncbi:MAG: phenylalanine--tRNA ligase subunit alpha [Elusimicrobia bacterium]|nr:phenylalanine--tRNA ligase subunit alpha [Elusimicrobiota bacterium]
MAKPRPLPEDSASKPSSASQIDELKEKALRSLAQAATLEALEDLRVETLGRKSELSLLLRSLAHMSIEEKRDLGSKANAARQALEQAFDARAGELRRKFLLDKASAEDLSLPGLSLPAGRRHPLGIVAERILEVFSRLGFRYVEGREIETDENNFTMLNIPEDHPARDMHDTLYLETGAGQTSGKRLLRTHTTPVWIPIMKNSPPPWRVVTCGKVFRSEAVDATHLPVFHQIDAFYVDSHCSLADLKATLELWAGELFGRGTAIRFRPSYFPFTEPSCEVEVRCFRCQGKGCPTCKNGWIEMLGAGMIHPLILKRLGHDPKQWRGFAFGLGLERVAMVCWGVPDIRLFYENNLEFLEQFKGL